MNARFNNRRRSAILASVGILILLGLIVAVHFAIDYRHGERPNYSRIERHLYMGGMADEPPPKTRAVLNVCEFKDPYQTEFYRWDPIRDAPPAPSLDWLRKNVEFVESNQTANVTTFVHCWAGASRSALVVTAYLMKKNGWPRDGALAYLRSKRPVANPNPAFMELLAEWERELNR